MNNDTVMWAYLSAVAKDVQKDLIYLLAFKDRPEILEGKIKAMSYYVDRAVTQSITEELADKKARDSARADILARGTKPYVPATPEGREALGMPNVWLSGPSAEELAKELGHDEELPENRLKQYSKDLLSGLG